MSFWGCQPHPSSLAADINILKKRRGFDYLILKFYLHVNRRVWPIFYLGSVPTLDSILKTDMHFANRPSWIKAHGASGDESGVETAWPRETDALEVPWTAEIQPVHLRIVLGVRDWCWAENSNLAHPGSVRPDAGRLREQERDGWLDITWVWSKSGIWVMNREALCGVQRKDMTKR